MYRTICGHCPTLNKRFSIAVEYIDNSDFTNRCYEKGTFTCEHYSNGGKCIYNSCPLFDSAPDQLTSI